MGNSDVIDTGAISRLSGSGALRHDLLMTMTAASPETINEIVDDVFLPLVTNFGENA